MGIREEMLEIIDGLPQRGIIKTNDIERFIDLMANDPRAIWHTQRLSGIGGSEVGVFVAARRGTPDAFGGTPNGIMLEKRLVYLPKKQTLAMRKGIVVEEGIRQIFLEDYHAKRDTDAIQAITEPKHRLREWVRYSPDDVVIIDGDRYLVDYKHPHTLTAHTSIITRYLAQLHLGTLVAEHEGVSIKGMLLVQYPEDGGDNLVVSNIPFDPILAEDMVDACDEAWQMLKQGQLYPQSVSKQAAPPPEVADQIDRLGDEFVKNKMIADRLYSHSSNAKESLIALLSQNSLLNEGVINAGECLKIAVAAPALNVKLLAQEVGDNAPTLPVYDQASMTAWLLKSGADMTQFETGARVPDVDAVVKMAELRGLVLDNFRENATRFTLAASADYKTTCRALADSALDQAPRPQGKQGGTSLRR